MRSSLSASRSNSMRMDGLTSENPMTANIFVTEFEDQDLVDFIDQMRSAEQSDIVQTIIVWVSSYGGNALNLLAMVDTIEASAKPVFTVATGKAQSAGAFLVAAGTPGHRFSMPNAQIMIHEMSFGAGGKTQDVVQQTMDASKLNDRLTKLLAKFTGQRADAIKSLYKESFNVDVVFTAEQAKKFGLVDHVGVPKVIIQPPQNMIAIFNTKARRSKSKMGKK